MVGVCVCVCGWEACTAQWFLHQGSLMLWETQPTCCCCGLFAGSSCFWHSSANKFAHINSKSAGRKNKEDQPERKKKASWKKVVIFSFTYLDLCHFSPDLALVTSCRPPFALMLSWKNTKQGSSAVGSAGGLTKNYRHKPLEGNRQFDSCNERRFW